MTVIEMAQVYYPKYWDADRIDALVAAGRLTKAQAKKIKERGGDDGFTTGAPAAAD